MLRNELERMIWAVEFSKRLDFSQCFNKAFNWAKENGVKGAGYSKLTEERRSIEEQNVVQGAAEHADATILMFRRHIIDNEEIPRTPHILDLTRYVTEDGELDFDS